jgi:hypothetical protein
MCPEKLDHYISRTKRLKKHTPNPLSRGEFDVGFYNYQHQSSEDPP